MTITVNGIDELRALVGQTDRPERLARGHPGGHRQVRRGLRRRPVDPRRRGARQDGEPVRHDDRPRQPHAVPDRRLPRPSCSSPSRLQAGRQLRLEQGPLPRAGAGRREDPRQRSRRLEVDDKGGGWYQLVHKWTVEVEGQEKPALRRRVRGQRCSPSTLPILGRSGHPRHRRSANASSAGRCRTALASTCSGRARARCSTWARRARSASAWRATSRSRARAGHRHGRPGRRHRLHRHRDRGRGAARRAELHQAPPAASSTSACATTSPIPTSGSRWTRTSRASTSPASSTAAAAPTSARSATPSACARRSTCSARSSSTAPATAREPGRASAAAPASTTSSSAARRPASATCRRRSTGRTSRRSSTSSRAATARSSARSSQGMKQAAEEQEFEQAALLPQPAQGGAHRCSSASGSRTRRSGRSTRSPSRPRASDANAQVFQVRDGVLPGPPELLPRERRARATRARWPRSSCSSTTRARSRSRRR